MESKKEEVVNSELAAELLLISSLNIRREGTWINFGSASMTIDF